MNEAEKLIKEGEALAAIGGILKDLPLYQAQRAIIAVAVLNGIYDERFGIREPELPNVDDGETTSG